MSLAEVLADRSPVDRRCAFRGCRAPLPPPSGRPGNRPKYCQDGRTWGPQELTCKAAEAAHLAVASLQGDGPLPPDGVAELAVRLDAAAGPLRELLDAVTATGAQLEHDVVTARAERDEARAAAAADRGARALAERDAAEARAGADAAADQARAAAAEAAAAVRDRDAAQARAREAERALVRGEGRLAAVEDRLRRAEELTAEASAQAARLDTELADALATLRGRDEALRHEQARTEELRRAHHAELAARSAAAERALAERDDTAERAAAEYARRLDELRAAHAAELERLSGAHTAELAQRAAAHAAELSRTAALHAAELDRRDAAAQARHEADLARIAVLDRALGAVCPPGPG